MSTSIESGKNMMTDEERIALCQKLDRELDDFIDSLEKKRYTEGWPEDRWEEEMEKHPFFMKSPPTDGELSPLTEGLARLKFDPEENTKQELANNYKEDGNFNFKHKNYRLAILGYTEGIKVKAEDAEINAHLYNNRAAAHWFLNNYRSALIDSERALSFKPEHVKARLRAAKCAMEIERYNSCIEHCEILLETQLKDEEIEELIKVAKKKKLLQDREERRKRKLQAKINEQNAKVIEAVIARGIRISKCDDINDLDLSKLEPCVPGAENAIVHLENGILKYPILLLYPEYQTTDFIRSCPENVPLISQLEQVFPAPWDEQDIYNLSTINIYFEGTDRLPHLVDPTMKLGDILLLDYYELKSGTPSFFVLYRDSNIERRYLQNYY